MCRFGTLLLLENVKSVYSYLHFESFVNLIAGNQVDILHPHRKEGERDPAVGQDRGLGVHEVDGIDHAVAHHQGTVRLTEGTV